MRYSGALSQPQASVSWWAIHSAVGCAVAPSHKIRRRSWCRISKPYRSRNEIVGTTKRSIATIPSAWLRRKVVQPWDGGRFRRAMYLATRFASFGQRLALPLDCGGARNRQFNEYDDRRESHSLVVGIIYHDRHGIADELFPLGRLCAYERRSGRWLHALVHLSVPDGDRCLRLVDAHLFDQDRRKLPITPPIRSRFFCRRNLL